ncbi:hypothetical protein T01_7107 [Trichinella spiralis]|uniref:Integrase catalytic domain-containing protein n=1 Tax=Trichinella spiralis TaxID=6334 RepID=A0A0V1AMG5_TRISP|nr:hypothetical protein T01_7107 [Trichinella spiralis]
MWKFTDTGETGLFQVIPRQKIPEIFAISCSALSLTNLLCVQNAGEDALADPCAPGTAMLRKLHVSMQLQPVSHPFQPVDMNVVILMDETPYGNHYILDLFLMLPVAFSLLITQARMEATALINGIFCRYESPETLYSYQGQSISECVLIKVVCQLFVVTITRLPGRSGRIDIQLLLVFANGMQLALLHHMIHFGPERTRPRVLKHHM